MCVQLQFNVAFSIQSLLAEEACSPSLLAEEAHSSLPVCSCHVT